MDTTPSMRSFRPVYRLAYSDPQRIVPDPASRVKPPIRQQIGATPEKGEFLEVPLIHASRLYYRQFHR